MIKFADHFKAQLLRHKVFMLAVMVSIMLHALLIIEFAFKLPFLDDENEHKTVLEARLVKLPAPAPKVTPVEKKKPQQPLKKKQSKPPAPTQPPAPAAEPEAVIAQETLQPAPGTLSSATLNMNPAGADMGTEISTGKDSEAGLDNAEAAATELNQDAEPQKVIFRHVETEFEVRRGINTSAAGITRIIFDINENGAYNILSQTEAKGLASLFFGNLVQKSEGIVTEQGLKPNFYSHQYGSDTKKLQKATFNWDEGNLHLHSNKGERTVPLPQGTQDFLSFMYQFMFSPPLDHMQITMTNGKKLGTYDYSFEGEETISSKLGKLNTIHLLRSRNDEEKTEIWLATDYQYLPVRILKTEKDGTVIEQLISSLTTKD